VTKEPGQVLTGTSSNRHTAAVYGAAVLLRLPANKTSGPFTKPVDSVVVQLIDACGNNATRHRRQPALPSLAVVRPVTTQRSGSGFTVPVPRNKEQCSDTEERVAPRRRTRAAGGASP
jgi:hypothetical protein